MWESYYRASWWVAVQGIPGLITNWVWEVTVMTFKSVFMFVRVCTFVCFLGVCTFDGVHTRVKVWARLRFLCFCVTVCVWIGFCVVCFCVCIVCVYISLSFCLCYSISVFVPFFPILCILLRLYFLFVYLDVLLMYLFVTECLYVKTAGIKSCTYVQVLKFR